MSDGRPPESQDADRDPIDVAYTQAEGVLDNETARANRRAAVLAAVAREPPASPDSRPIFAPRARRRLAGWRPAAWTSAACAAGLGIFVALRIYPFIRPQTESTPAASRPSPVSGQKPSPLASPPAHARPPRPSEIAAVAPSASAPPPPAPPTARRQSASTPPAAEPPFGEARRRALPAVPPVTVPQPPLPLPPVRAPIPAAIAPPAPPAPPPFPGPAAPSPAAPAPVARGAQAVPASPPAALDGARPDLGDALRSAAAAGRSTEVLALLEDGAPVDAADANGDTALMKSLRADRPEVAAILYRHGASLDRRDRSGESARDVAVRGDAALRRAVGLDP